MQKRICRILCLLLLCSLAVPAFAAGPAPEITLQPQNYHYPQYSCAIYTVKATGQNLHATWYMEFEGKTYNLSDNRNGVEPWEAYAGESYGPGMEGPDTFSWFFGGIEEGLNGAKIWCVLEDGHYDVKSEAAIITVQGSVMPPEILQMPASLSVEQGSYGELRCIARSASDAQLYFQWYETSSGKLWDIRAMDGEESDFLICNTQTPGTRYYVCCVTGSNGGMVYSSVVPVTVVERASGPQGQPPTLLTTKLPQGTVGEDYGYILETDDYTAEFSIAYNPGGANDFDKLGLSLSVEGMLMGRLTRAGTYTFTVCVANQYGEDYGVLTLVVTESASAPPETTPTETTEAPKPETGEDGTSEPTRDTEPAATDDTTTGETVPATQPHTPDSTDEQAGIPWLTYLLIIVCGLTTGLCVAFVYVFVKMKKKS